MLETLLNVVFGLASAILTVYAALEVRMLVGFWRTRKVADESDRATAEGSIAEAPTVTVQIPIYNEGMAVLPLLKAVASFDYPRDRMDIQVLDDSTDATSGIVCAKITRLRAEGLRISHIRRESRAGWKAGALDYGLRISDAEFVAVFDADFVPPSDYLRRALVDNSAFENPEVAFVQGRWSYTNWDQSVLTRTQAILLDRHFTIQKPYIKEKDGTTVFNGSGGVLRRAAIDTVGGWSSDTLCEDLDLSYRFALNGWTGVYDAGLASPSEIPSTLAAFKLQQRRWAKGSAQCMRKLTADILQSTLLRDRSDDLFVMFGYIIHPVLLIYSLLWPMVVLSSSAPTLLGIGQTALMFANVVAVAGFAATAIESRRSFTIASARDVFVAMQLGMSLMVNNTVAFLDGCIRRSGEFQRTPKMRNVATPRRSFRAHWSVVLELAYTAYMLGAATILYRAGYTMPAVPCVALGGVMAFFFLYQFVPPMRRIEPMAPTDAARPSPMPTGNA